MRIYVYIFGWEESLSHFDISEESRGYSPEDMEATLFYSSSVLPLPRVSALSRPKMGRSTFYSKDGPSLTASRWNRLQLAALSIRANGNTTRGPRQANSATGKTQKGDGEKIIQSSGTKLPSSSNQDEIIALFKRIQSSISKKEPVSSQKRNSKSSEKKPSAESVLSVLRQSRNQVKARPLSNEGNKESIRRKGLPEKGVKVDHPPTSDLKSTRLPSNFIKRSPIPSPQPSRRKVQLKNELASATDGDQKQVLEKVELKEEQGLEKIDEMKLPALKELAKTRGIKGYSKMKKSQLVELLRS